MDPKNPDDKELPKVIEKKPDEKVKETPAPAPKVETRVSRIVGLFQAEVKTLADRIDALEGKIPAGELEEEVRREERKEETENLFDEVGRRCAEILGVDA